MSTKKTEKQLTLRQQMRIKAETALKGLMTLMEVAAQRVVEEADTRIDPVDLMHMLTGSQTKTLHEKLVTELANELEQDLVKLWNDQQTLDLGGKDDSAAS